MDTATHARSFDPPAVIFIHLFACKWKHDARLPLIVLEREEDGAFASTWIYLQTPNKNDTKKLRLFGVEAVVDPDSCQVVITRQGRDFYRIKITFEGIEFQCRLTADWALAALELVDHKPTDKGEL